MAVYQILVRNLVGKTRCLRFESGEVSCEDVKAELAACEGVPGDLQRLVTGTRELGSGGILVAGADGVFPSCTLLLRLRGGKGGFGSLLRGAATKAGQKKTSNFDACRDMSGRRLRHVNAEKKLKEWKADAKERELEKTAEKFLKKHRKMEEEDKGLEKELEKFRKESLLAREEIGSAVMDGLVEAAKLGVDLKRKKVEAAVEFEVKKARTWSPTEEDDEDDSDEDDESGPSSSEKDETTASCSTKVEAGISDSNEGGGPSKKVYEQVSSQDTLCQPRAVEAEEIVLEYPEVSKGSLVSSADDKVSEKVAEEPTTSDRQVSAGSPVSGADDKVAEKVAEEPTISDRQVSKGSPVSSPVSSADDKVSGKVAEEPTISNRHSDSPIASTPSRDSGASAGHLLSSKVTDLTGPLDFEDYNTSKHLEVLGLERLKMELQSRGLKCGGSLSERASRLFVLKTTPLEKLDKSLFSKPSSKAARK